MRKEKDGAEGPCPLHGDIAMLASSKAEKVTSGGLQNKLIPFSAIPALNMAIEALCKGPSVNFHLLY